MARENFVTYDNLSDILNGIEQKISGLGSQLTGISIWMSNSEYDIGDVVIVGGSLFICSAVHTSSSSFSADISNWILFYADISPWMQNTYYSKGACVINDNKLYQCKTSHTSGTTFSDLDWLQIIGGTSIDLWKSSTNYDIGDLVIESNKLYRCNIQHISSASIDTTKFDLIGSSSDQITYWDSGTSYSINDLVIYNNNLYKCTVAHTSTISFEAANFVMVGGIEYSYDLSEKEVGEWVDASRVYQKTYKYETPSTLNTFLKLGDLEQNVSQVIYIQVTMEREVSYVGGVPDINSLSDPDPIKVVAYNNALYCKLYDNSQAQKDVYITVQYTKSA